MYKREASGPEPTKVKNRRYYFECIKNESQSFSFDNFNILSTIIIERCYNRKFGKYTKLRFLAECFLNGMLLIIDILCKVTTLTCVNAHKTKIKVVIA